MESLKYYKYSTTYTADPKALFMRFQNYIKPLPVLFHRKSLSILYKPPYIPAGRKPGTYPAVGAGRGYRKELNINTQLCHVFMTALNG